MGDGYRFRRNTYHGSYGSRSGQDKARNLTRHRCVKCGQKKYEIYMRDSAYRSRNQFKSWECIACH